MSTATTIRATLLTALLMGVLFVRPAHAYLDPGAGSYANQVIIAGALGGLFAVRLFLRGFWRTLMARLHRRTDNTTTR